MVLRRCTIQHLQNAHRPLSIEKMQPGSYPTTPSCGDIQKICENLPISPCILGACVLGHQVCQKCNLPFLVCAINCSNSLFLFHQFVPFFILCLDIIGNPDHANLEEDLVSIGWISDYAEMVIKERVELKPIMVIIKSMSMACQQTKTIRLVRAA